MIFPARLPRASPAHIASLVRAPFDSRKGQGVFVCPLPRGSLFSGCFRAFRWERPEAQGLRARRHWPSPRASVAVPGPRLLPSPSPLPFSAGGRPPERGQMLRRAGVRPLASVVQSRPASPRPRAWITAEHPLCPLTLREGEEMALGVRRLPWISFSGFSRAVASLSWRTGVDVCRLHAGLPALGSGIPPLDGA